MTTPHEDYTFGLLLRRHRRDAALSQEALAERAGLSAQAISALERGVRQAPYRDTVRALSDALGLAPAESAALEASVARRRGMAPARLSRDFAGGQDYLSGALPLERLLGRENAVERVRQLVTGGTRLVTLTGPGGVGKTRLALEVARDSESWFGSGAGCFVPLAPLRDHSLVASAIVSALGLREPPGVSSIELLQLSIGKQRQLLVIDNFEHVARAAPLLQELLYACPGLSILATSRSPLHIRGEHCFAVLPLESPDPDQLDGFADAGRFPAIDLFVTKASAAAPGFRLTTRNVRAVTAICRRLDGLPLAIELAAARARTLTPASLLEHLAPALPLLTGGSGDLPERHQTLRATLAWSYDLLDSSEQAVYRRLSVFAGGCTLDAAVAVCGVGAPLAVELLDRLGALLDQGLLQREPSTEADEDEPRFAMLETVREYGVELLVSSGEYLETARSHAEYFLVLAEEAEPWLSGKRQSVWQQRLAREHDNVRAALNWLLAAGQSPSMALRLATAVWRFWLARGFAREGSVWLERALAAPDHEDVVTPRVRARALTAAGALAHSQGQLSRAAMLATESLDLWRAIDDQSGIASALGTLGMVHKSRGDYAGAVRAFEAALSLWRMLGNDLRVSMTLNNLGATVYDSGDFDRFEAFSTASLNIKRALGDVEGIAIALFNLGEAARSRRNYQRARRLLAESLEYFRAQHLGPRIAQALHSIGVVAQAQGDHRVARSALRESLSRYRALGDRTGIVLCLEAFATVAVAGSDDRQGAKLFAVADAAREELGYAIAPVDRSDYDDTVAGIKGRLGHESFTATWASARAIPLDVAVDEIVDQTVHAWASAVNEEQMTVTDRLLGQTS